MNYLYYKRLRIQLFRTTCILCVSITVFIQRSFDVKLNKILKILITPFNMEFQIPGRADNREVRSGNI